MYKYDIISNSSLSDIEKSMNDAAKMGYRVVGFSAVTSLSMMMYYAALERKVFDSNGH